VSPETVPLTRAHQASRAVRTSIPPSASLFAARRRPVGAKGAVAASAPGQWLKCVARRAAANARWGARCAACADWQPAELHSCLRAACINTNLDSMAPTPCLLIVLALLSGAENAQSVQQYWWRYPASDCGYDDVAPAQSCQGSDLEHCKARCLATSGCGGFNYPHGVLKKTDCLAHKKPEGSVDLYVLEDTPQPPPATAAWGTVWPVPQSSQWQRDGAPPLTVSSAFAITVDATSPARSSARLARAVQRYTGVIGSSIHAAAAAPLGAVSLSELSLQIDSADEALTSRTNASYTLTVTSTGAVVKAPTIYGAMYGMETFSQLALPNSSVINASSVSYFFLHSHHG
jgi:hypothetical protein